jgi:Spy/CpxP family protein refolding chaperone
MQIALRRLLGTALVGLAALWLATPASAQGFRWWLDPHFQHELHLTSEQVERIEAIWEKARPELHLEMQALEAAEREFDRLVLEAADEAVIEYVEIVEGARAQLNKSRTVMLLRMRRVLTSDQHATLTALNREREDAEREGLTGYTISDRR